MKLVSRFALATALVLGGGAVLATSPAQAKKKEEAPAQPAVQLSKEERAALLPLQTAITAKDWAAAQAALPAAEAGANTGAAKRFLGYMQLQVGVGTNNEALQARGIETLLASGMVAAKDLPPIYSNQAALALRATPPDNQKAETAFTRLLELTPNDPEVLIALAKVKADLRKPIEAMPLIDRAIAAKKATGQPVDATWYRYALRIAYEGKRVPEALKLSRDLIASYPTNVNWRDSLLIYRDLVNPDKTANIDLMRLMRATKSLTGERDWFELAEALDNGGLPGESKAVLEEGSALKMVDLNKPAFRDLLRMTSGRIAADRASLGAAESKAMGSATGQLALNTGDAYFGYGDSAKAIALYRAALTKGSVDANLVNLHLGMALAKSGDRAGAEAAFRAVTGPRADIAGYWLIFLAQRPA
jgi:tetratricopeptide (TPR) repeat protein